MIGEAQPNTTSSQEQQEKAVQGDKTTENVRHGQAISEQGVRGQTTEAIGKPNQGTRHRPSLENVEHLLIPDNMARRGVWVR